MKKGTRCLAMVLVLALLMSVIAPGQVAEAASPEKPGKAKITSVKAKNASTIQVKWKKASKAKGYQILVSTNKKFKKDKKTITTTKKSKVIKNLKGNKAYYVKVRAYNKVGKKKVYGKWSKVKKVKTSTATQTVKKLPIAEASDDLDDPDHSDEADEQECDHVWEEVYETGSSEEYDPVPTSEAQYPYQSGKVEYFCLCRDCDAVNLKGKNYFEDIGTTRPKEQEANRLTIEEAAQFHLNDFREFSETELMDHLCDKWANGWYELVLDTRMYCKTCGRDVTGEEMSHSRTSCPSSVIVSYTVPVRRIFHWSAMSAKSYITTVGYRCTRCGEFRKN